MVKSNWSNFSAAAAEADAGYGQYFSVLMRQTLFGYWVYYVAFCLYLPAITLIAKPTYQSSVQLLLMS